MHPRKGEQRSKFDSSRVDYNLQRLGLHKQLKADSLEGRPMKKLGKRSIICKILMSKESEKDENFFVIPLKHADRFVTTRMSENFKQRDWHLFSSNYTQSKIIFSR